MMNSATVNYHPGKLTRFIRKLAWYFTVFLPPQREVTIPTRNGVLTFNSKDKTTGRNLYVYRDHEFDEMMDYVSLLRTEGYLDQGKNRVVLDVGGYLGMSSTAFLLEDIFDKSVAFEPFPDSYRLLQRNVANNHLQGRMIGHNMALSDADGTLEFELSEKNYGDHRVRSGEHRQPDAFGENKRTVIRVTASRFDDLDDNTLGVSKDDIRLVWMDIQGHEGRFIKGASSFFKEHPNVPIVMEFWPYAIKRSGVEKKDFLQLIEDLFSGYYVKQAGKFKYRDMESLDAFFDEQDHPGKGSTIVLCNKINT